MEWILLYASVMAIVLLIAWQSGNHVIQKLSLLMLLAWVGANVFVECLGKPNAAYVLPVYDAIMAVLVAVLGYKNKSNPCLAVVLLFALEETIDVFSFSEHLDGTHLHYALLNGIFVLRMAVVGGVGLVDVARRALDQRPRAHLRHYHL